MNDLELRALSGDGECRDGSEWKWRGIQDGQDDQPLWKGEICRLKFLSPAKNPRPSARRSEVRDLKHIAAIFKSRPADTRNGTYWETHLFRCEVGL